MFKPPAIAAQNAIERHIARLERRQHMLTLIVADAEEELGDVNAALQALREAALAIALPPAIRPALEHDNDWGRKHCLGPCGNPPSHLYRL